MAEVYRVAYMRRRWFIVGAAFLAYLFVLMVAGSLLVRLLVSEHIDDLAPAPVARDMIEVLDEPVWWTRVGLMALIFVALQFLFIIPLLGRKPPIGRRSKRLILSLVVAIVISAAMLGAFALALWELTRLYLSPIISEEIASILFVMFFLVSWSMWSFALFIFTRTIWADHGLARMMGLMLGGTIVETITVIPTDVMIRRRSDCYCFSGSFLSLCLAGFVLMWLAGPGFLLAMTAKKHRMWRERHCRRCGYAMGPSPGQRCPECGFAWQPANAAAGQTLSAASANTRQPLHQ